ncbi:MAG TPA: nucleoside kinase, partial [Candidatus Pullilachnospira stercoravium]|nr:nucleoside kinase [Candidatus Pullilachnospira stercoravium]
MGNRLCQVTVCGETKAFPEGTPFGEIVKEFSHFTEYPVVLVMADGKLRELHKKLHRDCRVQLITTADGIGHKAYKRSMNLLFLKAVYHVAGHENIRKVVLRFAVDAGFYYTIDGNVTVDQAFLDQVDAYMRSLVEKELPVMKRSISTSDAVELFHRYGMYDKEKLFRFRRVSRVNVYRLEDFEDYYYGYMVW